MSSNRSQHQQQEDWQSDTSAFPVIPPDSTTSSSASTSLTSALPAPLNSSSSAPLDVSSIDGNVSDQAKRHVMDMLAYYTGAKEESFGVAIARRLQMRSMNVWATSPGNAQGRIPQRATEAQTIFEIPITKDMCNPYGTLHGACACYIVDPGTRLRAISTSIFIEGRIRTARVEIMDSETDKLYVSAIHSTIGPKPDSRAKLAKL
ncbi:hypothetical protein HHX47_DHR5000628 [Lentinula edodes]|nr:hypothetical protein HHX47_DHR5000628 [Lentinula edodes]